MQSSKLAIIGIIILISLGSLGQVYAAPSANLTLASGQTTPAQTYKDNSGVTLWQYITSPIATLLSKFIIIYPTGLTHIRGYQFPDANTTVLGNNITQTVSGSNNFTNSWLNFFKNPTILTPHRIVFPTNGSGTVCLRNQTGSCGTSVGGGVTSINGNGTAAQLITANSIQGNLTVKDSGNIHKIGLGQSVAVLNTTQTFTGAKAFKGPANHSILNFTDSTGKLVSSISQNGLYNGPISVQNGPDYTIYNNSTDLSFYLVSGKNGTVLQKSLNSSDSGVILQTAINDANATSALGKGAWIDVDCGAFPIAHDVLLPRNGNMTLTGHGAGCTVFYVPTNNKNNVFVFKGNPSAASFFNYFAHFGCLNNFQTGTSNDCFKLNSTNQGISDSTWYDLNIQNFGMDDIFMSTSNQWNNKIHQVVFEYAGRSNLYANAGSDLRIIDNKFLYNQGTKGVGGISTPYGCSITFNGTQNVQLDDNYFSKNKYCDINMDNTTKEIIITHNIFSAGSDAGAGRGDNILLQDGVFNKIADNIFNSVNVNYNINFTGLRTNISSKNMITNNLCASCPIKGMINIPNSNKVIGATFNNVISNNLGYNTPNYMTAGTDPSKQAFFSGMQNFPRSHAFNFTFQNNNGSLGLVGSYNSTTATNKTGTSSTSQVMYGSPLVTTLNGTGKTVINVNGETQDSALSGGCRVELRYSTSYMGGNGVAATGTQVGSNIDTNTASANQVTRFTDSWTVQLTKNTKYYFDVSFANNGAAGTCTLSDVDWNVYELQ